MTQLYKCIIKLEPHGRVLSTSVCLQYAMDIWCGWKDKATLAHHRDCISTDTWSNAEVVTRVTRQSNSVMSSKGFGLSRTLGSPLRR